MTSLARLQQDLQSHVLTGDGAILAAINGTTTVPAATRVAVYFNAYRARLVEALASNVPRLQQLLGEQEFATLARQYIEDHPSRYASVRWFGDRLAQSLAQSHPAQPWLAELARWEWAIAASFDARDAAPLGTDALAAIAPGEWAGLRLRFHPSLQLLAMRTNAPALFKALTEKLPTPEPAVLERPQSWLLWRQELTTQYRSLEPSELAALELVRAEGTFASMCEQLCDWHEPEQVPVQAAGMLKRWIVEGLVTTVAPGEPAGDA